MGVYGGKALCCSSIKILYLALDCARVLSYLGDVYFPPRCGPALGYIPCGWVTEIIARVSDTSLLGNTIRQELNNLSNTPIR